MITLKVEGYCQNCPWFDPETKKDVLIISGLPNVRAEAETEVICKSQERCAAIAEMVKRSRGDG